MLALIDADTACYASASMAEGMNEQVARWNVNNAINDILRQLNTQDYQLYLTGPKNFRYGIFPEYKANRLKMKRPEHLQVCKQHLIDEWGAILSDGVEADDLLGIDLTKYNEQDIPALISSIDKDLNMIPGLHHNPRRQEQYIVSPQDAIRFFYYQLLVGDTADGIKGASGIGPKKAERILTGLTTEADLYEACLPYFSCEEELLMNGQCLWIWRKENDLWKLPTLADDADQPETTPASESNTTAPHLE